MICFSIAADDTRVDGGDESDTDNDKNNVTEGTLRGCSWYIIMASLDVAISIRVKDHNRIRASLQTLNVDKDYFPSLPDGKIDSSETVMSQNEVVSLDEIKDSLRTSENDYEALATDDCIEAELEKLINMTPEEADAADEEARGKSYVALREARDATSKAEKAVRHFEAIMEALEKYPRTEREKACRLKAMASRARGRRRKPRESRMDAAVDAMKSFGFEEKLIKQTVKDLLKVYGGTEA